MIQFRHILREEHYKGNCPFTNEVALNLDKVEIQLKKGIASRKETVDFVVGLEKKWLLLVEAKFDADNVENITKSIKGKITHSKQLLQTDNFVHLEKSIIVLLSNVGFEVKSNKLRRLLMNNPSIKPYRVC